MDRRLRKLQSFMRDFWYIIRLYIEVPPQNDIKSWDSLIDEAGRLDKKYRGEDPEGRFACDCIQAWLKYINNKTIKGD